MRFSTLTLLCSLALAAGCSSPPPSRGPDPSDPGASETPWVAPVDRLAGDMESLAPPAAVEGATYTCPMHPEVKSDKPGTCPKCGMNLEIVKAPDHGETNPKEHEHK